MSRLRPIVKWMVVAMAAAFLTVEIAIMLFPRRILTVDSGEVKADAIVVLGGCIDRPWRAAELFQEGVAPVIIVSGTGDGLINVGYLESHGVPSRAITLEGLSSSTLENANFSIPLLRQMGARRVVLVTTWYHSRRALACFRHFAPDITFYSRPSYRGYFANHPNPGNVAGYVAAEALKLPGYWLFYGVRPF